MQQHHLHAHIHTRPAVDLYINHDCAELSQENHNVYGEMSFLAYKCWKLKYLLKIFKLWSWEFCIEWQWEIAIMLKWQLFSIKSERESVARELNDYWVLTTQHVLPHGIIYLWVTKWSGHTLNPFKLYLGWAYYCSTWHYLFVYYKVVWPHIKLAPEKIH